jgi:hypothetical protein
MRNTIVIAEPRPVRTLWLEFADGQAGEVDLAPVIARGGVYSSLNVPAVFDQVRVGERGRYIEFPGNVDFCADALREKMVPAAEIGRRRK